MPLSYLDQLATQAGTLLLTACFYLLAATTETAAVPGPV